MSKTSISTTITKYVDRPSDRAYNRQSTCTIHENLSAQWIRHRICRLARRYFSQFFVYV